MNFEKFLTFKDVAKYVNMSERYIKEERKRGNLKCVKMGSRVRFDPKEVEKWAKRKSA